MPIAMSRGRLGGGRSAPKTPLNPPKTPFFTPFVSFALSLNHVSKNNKKHIRDVTNYIKKAPLYIVSNDAGFPSNVS